jgi:hypothetical protein
MTTVTYVDFVQQPKTPFQFDAVLDGETYSIICTWNLFAQRYYVNIYTVNQVLVLAIARIGSPSGYDISMTAGYFATKLIWREANNQFEVIEP